jgi:hypothetical protein
MTKMKHGRYVIWRSVQIHKVTSMCWVGTKNGEYSVRSAYHLARENHLMVYVI